MNNIQNKLMQFAVTVRGKSFVKKSNQLIDNGLSAFRAEKGSITGSKKLCHSDELNAVKNAEQGLRNFVKANTVRLGDLQVISPKRYMKVKQEVNERMETVNRAIDALVAAWDDICKADKTKLGALYNAADYPTKEEVRGAFGVETKTAPLPSTSFDGLGLSADDTAELTADLLATISEDVGAMTKDLLYKLVMGSNPDTNKGFGNGLLYASQRLASDDSFKAGTLTNVADIAEIVRDLNALDNPSVEQHAARIAAMFSGLDAASLRTDEQARAALADAAKAQLAEIERAMAGFC